MFHFQTRCNVKIFYKFIIIYICIRFFFKIFEFYNSNVYIDRINKNRGNIEKLILEKNNLPILNNDTENVIEFNSGFPMKKKIKRKIFGICLKNEKKSYHNKSFWNKIN